jgi:hypothetical protein
MKNLYFIFDMIANNKENTAFNLLVDSYDTLNKIMKVRFDGILRVEIPNTNDSVLISNGQFNLRI